MSNVTDLCGLGLPPLVAQKIDDLYVDNTTAETVAGAKTFTGAMVASGNFTAGGAVKVGVTTTDILGFFGATGVSRLAAAAQVTITATTTASGNGCGFVSQAAATALVASVAEIQNCLTQHGLWKGAA